jgi:hypothetical protein
LTHGANPNIVVSTFNVPQLCLVYLLLREKIVLLNIGLYTVTY